MRSWPALLLLAGAVAVPALAGGAACPNLHDPALLPALADVAAAARAGGVEVAPLGPLVLGSAAPETHACGGKIRPGAFLVINHAIGCTANFVFTDLQGQLYIGTAGHCVPNLAWKDIEIAGTGIDFGDPVFLHNGLGDDVALIRIDPAHHDLVEPTMCHWGGPASVPAQGTTGTPRPDVAGLQYGWGAVWNEHAETRARPGVLPPLVTTDTWEIALGSFTPGDSGSPLEDAQGGALMIVTNSLLAPSPAPPLGLGLGIGTRVDHALDLARAAGLDLRLVPGRVPVDLTGLTVPE
ncbi:MAG TPA: hypothetical protein VGR28_12195 [Candidatus Thermoplasmatota archaeon]|jgi:hypothetical protein|nr:hypothetical protein [Candidatus Thermoplasmatota archaeon]